jgi:hypothetical protein
MTMHDHDHPDGERARHAIGRARLIARLDAEAERLNRRWLPPFSRAWLAAAAVVAVALGTASLLPLRDTSRPVTAVVETGALPVASLTPGATIEIDVRDVCDDTPRPPQTISTAVRQAVVRGYGMESVPEDQYELDYLITPQLGGAPDARNLWPQRYQARVWNAGVKDQLEDLLPRLVCEGRVDLRTAQHDIAADWVAAYRKYFRTTSPVEPPAAVALLAFDAPLSPSFAGIDYHKRFVWSTSALTP